MQNIPRNVLVLLALGIVAVFAYSVTRLETYPEARHISEGVKGFPELQGRFAELTREKGATYAFEVLKRAQLPPNSDIHFIGHTIGDELYKQKGVAGIAECTDDARNACSHSIVIGAFVEYGTEALPKIFEVCQRAPGGTGAYTMCYHGMGHGVFAYFGYSIPKMVGECKKTGTEERNNQEYIECVGGAIMELVGGGGHDPELMEIAREKYLSESDPLSVCMGSQIPDDAKSICLIYLPPWIWTSVGIDLGKPSSRLFPEAFAICEKIPDSPWNLRAACFGSFGKEFVPLAGARDIRRIEEFTDEEFSIAISWCMLAPKEGRGPCVAEGVASVLWGGENDPRVALRFCSIVKDDEVRGACYTRLAEDMARYITRDVERRSLCERIPEEYQSGCGGGFEK